MKPPKKEPLFYRGFLGEIHINPILRGPHPLGQSSALKLHSPVVLTHSKIFSPKDIRA
jgi:hypothetical protein